MTVSDTYTPSRSRSSLMVLVLEYATCLLLFLLSAGGIAIILCLLSEPGLKLERKIHIEASVDEIWQVISSPDVLLRDFPIGDNLELARKAGAVTVTRLSPGRFDVLMESQPASLVTITVVPESREIWLQTQGSRYGKDDSDWFRVLKITPLESTFCLLVVSTWRPAEDLWERMKAFWISGGMMNLYLEDYLYFLRERLEIRRRK